MITRAELARRLGADKRVGEPAGPVVVEAREPERFMAAFAEAVASGADVFLFDPTWSDSQRAEANAIVAAARGDAAATIASIPRLTLQATGRGWLMVPSGGTSGRVKFARHDEETVAAAVRGFAAYFEMGCVNAIGVLPLYHVSGFMAWMRCALTGGTYHPWDWKRLEAGEWPELEGGAWVLSLVPTQLQRLLVNVDAVAWLRRLAIVFVGGGSVWPELADAAAAAGVRVSLSYGMTETAAMVTALRPVEFLSGERSSGRALPHARVSVNGEGLVRIEGESVFRGYYPAWSEERVFVTEDLGEVDDGGRLRVLGRRDAVVISGGKKIDPAAVEAVLRGSGEFEDVAVIGVPDAEWGEAVVACYPAGANTLVPSWSGVEEAMSSGLAAHQRPKRFVAVREWPRNEQGKVNRAALRALVGESR